MTQIRGRASKTRLEKAELNSAVPKAVGKKPRSFSASSPMLAFLTSSLRCFASLQLEIPLHFTPHVRKITH